MFQIQCSQSFLKNLVPVSPLLTTMVQWTLEKRLSSFTVGAFFWTILTSVTGDYEKILEEEIVTSSMI